MLHVYWCVRRACRAYHTEIKVPMAPAEYRRLFSRSLSCNTCGAVLRWLRTQ